jgi:hypothetical protein
MKCKVTNINKYYVLTHTTTQNLRDNESTSYNENETQPRVKFLDKVISHEYQFKKFKVSDYIKQKFTS